jgi:hypothetical protein
MKHMMTSFHPSATSKAGASPSRGQAWRKPLHSNSPAAAGSLKWRAIFFRPFLRSNHRQSGNRRNAMVMSVDYRSDSRFALLDQSQSINRSE